MTYADTGNERVDRSLCQLSAPSADLCAGDDGGPHETRAVERAIVAIGTSIPTIREE